MLGFVQSFFAAKCNPIGVDFGSDCLRMAQVQQMDKEYKLIAAATADVPSHVRHDPNARLNFFVETVRDLLVQGKFQGRQAILGLPASSMFIQHLRMPKLDADGMKKALPWELRGKLPIDPSHAQLRHIVAGDIYEGQEAKSEVIVIAAAKEMVHQLLAAASKAKLDVIGMNVEPKALVDCFSQIYRRKSDEGVTNCFVDIGCVASRAVIARGADILFARTIPVGGDHFSRATANALNIKLDEAKLLRVKVAVAAPGQLNAAAVPAKAPDPKEVVLEQAHREATMENSFALLSAGLETERRRVGVQVNELAGPQYKAEEVTTATAVAEVAPTDDELTRDALRVEQACREPLNRLIEELELCRRYYETTFTNQRVDRLIFVGGEARQKALCQAIAKSMGLAAQVGDPLVKVGRNSDVGVEGGIDRRCPQPGWATAVGLSIGPANNGAK